MVDDVLRELRTRFAVIASLFEGFSNLPFGSSEAAVKHAIQ